MFHKLIIIWLICLCKLFFRFLFFFSRLVYFHVYDYHTSIGKLYFVAVFASGNNFSSLSTIDLAKTKCHMPQSLSLFWLCPKLDGTPADFTTFKHSVACQIIVFAMPFWQPSVKMPWHYHSTNPIYSAKVKILNSFLSFFFPFIRLGILLHNQVLVERPTTKCGFLNNIVSISSN